eukprot:2939776-Prymnesium_polylepis.1
MAERSDFLPSSRLQVTRGGCPPTLTLRSPSLSARPILILHSSVTAPPPQELATQIEPTLDLDNEAQSVRCACRTRPHPPTASHVRPRDRNTRVFCGAAPDTAGRRGRLCRECRRVRMRARQAPREHHPRGERHPACARCVRALHSPNALAAHACAYR